MQNKTKINKEIGSFDGIIRPKMLNTECLTFQTFSAKKIKYSGLKMVGVSLIAVFLLVSLSSVGSTMSFFNDVEKSVGNFFQADPVYFTVAMATSTQIDMSLGTQVILPVMIPGEDSEPIQYFVTAQMTGGDSVLCDAIHVLGTFPFPYDGPLLGIVTATTTDVGAWTLSFSLASGNTFATSTSCNVELTYKGWNADSVPGKGYSNTEKISLVFYVNATSSIPVILPDITSEISSDSTNSPQATTSRFDLDIASTTPETSPVIPVIDTGGPSTGSGSSSGGGGGTSPPVDLVPPSSDDLSTTTPEVIVTPLASTTPPVVDTIPPSSDAPPVDSSPPVVDTPPDPPPVVPDTVVEISPADPAPPPDLAI